MRVEAANSTWPVKRLWENRRVSHPAGSESSCSSCISPRRHSWLQRLFAPANLPALFTGEISGDKQLLLCIKSYRAQVLTFFFLAGYFHFQSITAQLQIWPLRHKWGYMHMLSTFSHYFSLKEAVNLESSAAFWLDMSNQSLMSDRHTNRSTKKCVEINDGMHSIDLNVCFLFFFNLLHLSLTSIL